MATNRESVFNTLVIELEKQRVLTNWVTIDDVTLACLDGRFDLAVIADAIVRELRVDGNAENKHVNL